MGLKLKCLWKSLVRCTDPIHEREKTSTCEFSLLFYHLLHLQSEIPLVLWPVLLTDTGQAFLVLFLLFPGDALPWKSVVANSCRFFCPLLMGMPFALAQMLFLGRVITLVAL